MKRLDDVKPTRQEFHYTTVYNCLWLYLFLYICASHNMSRKYIYALTGLTWALCYDKLMECHQKGNRDFVEWYCNGSEERMNVNRNWNGNMYAKYKLKNGDNSTTFSPRIFSNRLAARINRTVDSKLLFHCPFQSIYLGPRTTGTKANPRKIYSGRAEKRIARF